MPVDTGLHKEGMIYQREQYAKGGVGRRYWDYRDCVAFGYLKGTCILDVGCGEGITLEKLAARFPEGCVQGVDTEPENISICKTHALPVQQGSVYALPFADNTFDSVLFSEVIEHLDDPDRALREIHRVLRPGGRVVIVFPNDLIFFIARLAMGMVREAFYNPGHVRQWNPRSIRKLLHSTGLIEAGSRSLPFPVWPFCLHYVVTAAKE
jgi:ubiquinone/menaquinone biosynthesis C-methylase UbiE